MNDEVTKFFFFFSNDTYTPFDIVVKNKMIQYDTIEVCTKNT